MKISVLMAVYCKDDPDLMVEALFSNSIRQIKKPDEFVLVIDGPLTSKLEDAVQKCRMQIEAAGIYFKNIRVEKNKGLANALNIGLQECRNEFVARADADDISYPERFERQILLLTENKLDVVFSYQDEFEGDPKNIVSKKLSPLNNSDIRRSLVVRCVIPHSAVMYKRSLVILAGGYRIGVGYLEDYDLHLRMRKHGAKYGCCSDSLIAVSISEAQRYRRGGFKYAFTEIRTRFMWLIEGLIPFYVFVFVSPAYFIFRMAPVKLKRIMYCFVRKKI